MRTIPRGFKPFAFIAGAGYEAAVRARNLLYDWGLLQRKRLRSPVISIGNITAGGTGKTPLVIFTAGVIAEMGFAPVVLSRGYGRADPDAVRIIPPGEPVPSAALEMGDEPALIRRHIPEAWFGISTDRFAAGAGIEADAGRTVFILDDGMQHRKLRRNLDIAVIDATQPLGSNRLLPRGTLREPLSGLRRCTAIILNGREGSDKSVPSKESLIKALAPQADVFQCEQHIEKLVPFGMWEKSSSREPNAPPRERVFIVAALGNPARFHKDVRDLGLSCSGFRFFSDHHPLSDKDWDECLKEAVESGAGAIVISEKDAVKIVRPPDFPLLVAVQATRFHHEKAFRELLRRHIGSYR